MSSPILIKPHSFEWGFFVTFVLLMKHTLNILILFIFLLANKFCFSSETDSLIAINHAYDSILKSDEQGMDVLFYKHKNDVLINNLGPFGSVYYYATTDFLYNNTLIKEEKEFSKNLFKLQGIKPYTNIKYINASRKEQILAIKHYQQFGKQLTFKFDLNKVSTPGMYINQEANNSLFNVDLNYRSKNNNYALTLLTSIQRDFFEENGGVSNLKDFENAVYDNERVYGVNLFSSNSFFKGYTYNITQRVDLFKMGTDSLKANKLFFKHSFTYESKHRVFYDNDPGSDLYRTILIDSISTVDSIYSNTYANTIAFGIRTNRFETQLFAENDIIEYYQSYGLDTNYYDNYIGASGKYGDKKIILQGLAKYGITGYRKNDLLTDFLGTYEQEKIKAELSAGFTIREPDLKYVNYTSNHYQWRNYSFNKQTITRIGGKLKLKEKQLELSVETKLLNNALYYDTLSNAAQYNKAISFSTFSVAKDYRLYKFYFRSAFIYQLSSNKNIVPLPEIIGRQIIYYQKHIFKGVLKMQLGVGFSYATDYYGYNYSPALSEFYAQSNKQLGYYPGIDVFLNTHLKRAQIFLKYEHINSGSSLSKSYLVPGYPQMNKSLKFGVSWNMFD